MHKLPMQPSKSAIWFYRFKVFVFSPFLHLSIYPVFLPFLVSFLSHLYFLILSLLTSFCPPFLVIYILFFLPSSFFILYAFLSLSPTSFSMSSIPFLVSFLSSLYFIILLQLSFFTSFYPPSLCPISFPTFCSVISFYACFSFYTSSLIPFLIPFFLFFFIILSILLSFLSCFLIHLICSPPLFLAFLPHFLSFYQKS